MTRRRRWPVIFLGISLGLLVLAVIVIAASGGGAKPLTAVQKCSAAYQAYVSDGLNGMPDARVRASGSANDVKILDAAHKACDPLTPAQAKQAAASLSP